MSMIKAQCACGANQMTFSSAPLARLICHCQVCQAYTGKAFSDICIFLGQHLDQQQSSIQATQFKRYKLPPNINRGLCKYCQQPSIEFGLFKQIVIVSTENIQHQEQLPPAAMHIFYHRHVVDVQDHLPKINGFIYSQMMASKSVMQGIVKKFL